MDGTECGQEEALELVKDHESRKLEQTVVTLAGRQVWVITTFVPVDMNDATWGTATDSPHTWVTEVVGGPDDINGRHETSSTRDEAIIAHALMVEAMLASGCEMM
jgi:hypothetical protein